MEARISLTVFLWGLLICLVLEDYHMPRARWYLSESIPLHDPKTNAFFSEYDVVRGDLFSWNRLKKIADKLVAYARDNNRLRSESYRHSIPMMARIWYLIG